MKMCKTIPIFILLFTGCLCNADDVTPSAEAEITSVSTKPAKGLSPPEDHTQASTEHSGLGTTPRNVIDQERHLSSVVVAGISISFVLLFIIIIAGVWYAKKKSQTRSAEINSVLSAEPGVSLRNISTNENQP